MCEITTVCKLKQTDTAIIACLYDSLGCLCVLVIEHRDHRSGGHLVQYRQFIEFCHFNF